MIGTSEAATEQIEFEILDKEYRRHVETLKAEWVRENHVDSKDVYEVMRPEERARVHHRLGQWDRYITPLAEAWWKERGFGVTWPDDNSKPMQVCKLETAQ